MSNIYNDLVDILGETDVKQDESMSKHTSFKVGGDAEFFCTVPTEEKLIDVINYAKNNNIMVTVVGNGTNLLVRDKGIRGIVIKYLSKNYEIDEVEKINTYYGDNDAEEDEESTEEAVEEKNDTDEEAKPERYNVYVESGALNGALAQMLASKELTGFEFAAGIPGTIGGAIYMNAGCFGREFKDIVKEVTYLDMDDLKIYTIQGSECEFGYRTSIFEKKHWLILSAILGMEKGVKTEIKEKMSEYKEKRQETQPLDFPSAGSTFKRGDGFITAKLIDDAGLKGYSIGDAEVSTKHAGFIINKGNATAKDIIDLINYVKKVVKEKFNVDIQEEVRIIGE
jgi:UDP-N-acetylmuramate dehydrogenase